jgi:Bacterial Ig-like domain (group 1)
MNATARPPRRRAARFLILVMLLGLAVVGFSPAAHASTTTHVAYITDFGAGLSDPVSPPAVPGSSIFNNAITGSPLPNNGVYHGATFTDVPLSTIDANPAILTTGGFDTLLLYETCTIGSPLHLNARKAINAFFANGGKVMIFDADACSTAFNGLGVADWSGFLFPFKTTAPGPLGQTGSYLVVIPSTLTAGLVVGPQPSDAVGDANVFTSSAPEWCVSIVAQSNAPPPNNVPGFVEAYARTPAGGLAIYEGEDFWFTWKGTGLGPADLAHLKQVFDLMLAQPFNPDGLPAGAACPIPASHIILNPPSQSLFTGSTATVTATVKDSVGNPVAGVTVTFKVTSGPDAGLTGSGTSPTNASGNASFNITGASAGTDTVVASFVDSTGTTDFSNPVTVDWEAPIKATGINVSAVEGAPFTGPVASFTDPDPASTAAEYAATINWGDGTSPGTISGPTGGPFTVSGSHTYEEEGSYPVTVTITDVDFAANTATAHSTATVADAPLASTCATPAVSSTSFSGPVAGLTDADPHGMVSDYTATIDWGDITSTPGTVSGPFGGPFTVSGSHTYATTGPFTITVSIADVGGSKTMVTCKVLIFGAVAGGNFVIGDKNAAVGTAVTFWGARWWKLNSLSGGAAPPAFKGFENAPSSLPSCGTGWSTAPGNSPPPPAAPLPAFMAVIVSSSISKAGSTISGNTVHEVIVKTNPGYAPNPGHPGTGRVVATIC